MIRQKQQRWHTAELLTWIKQITIAIIEYFLFIIILYFTLHNFHVYENVHNVFSAPGPGAIPPPPQPSLDDMAGYVYFNLN